ncbi:hypothetical protein O9H85_31280 [Paenibacillus filicis]|uniref:DUF3311 domain-containing protein n=1 Tax=Paenibacillus gyeongsangnamensis TaxID=3388067 RepID=A0ABT4QIR7_9BACL|nr:hypothetical protein [Paenibacillus filicis]MCZ8516769.1 hypothetical protein [Paenibacillus filicis]
MKKMILFFVLLLLYPVFLKAVHIWDMRAIPLIVPYALGCLSCMVIVSEIGAFALRKLRPSKED